MIYIFGNCELDTDSYTLSCNGERSQIRPKAYKVLNYLLEHRERVVSKEELCNAVWNGRCVSDAAIESTVMAARRAVGDSGAVQRIIQTFPCFGYRFVARAKAKQSSLETDQIPEVFAETDQSESMEPVAPRRSSRI